MHEGQSQRSLTEAEQSVVDRVFQLSTDVAGEPSPLISLTRKLIEAPSENPPGDELATVLALEQACADRGLMTAKSEAAPGRPNFTALLPGGDEPGLLFLGHSDVVPAGPGWTQDPFTAVVRDGRIYGRGSTDMKAGLAAVVIAMQALAESGITLRGPVQLACTVDEEDLGIGIRHMVSEGTAHSFAGCVVAEPTDLETVIACRGATYLSIVVKGIAAHSGRPTDGRSAITAAARIVDLIRQDHDSLPATDALLGGGTWNVGRIEGGQAISIVAPLCTIGVDRRLLPEESGQEIAEHLRTLIRDNGIDRDGIDVTVETTMEMPGFRIANDHPLATTAVDALRDCGTDTTITGWTAACDGGFINRDWGIPAIVLGPGELNDQAHKPDESCRIDEIRTAAAAYALIAMRMLA